MMSVSLTAAPSLLLLCFFSVQGAGLIHAGYDSSVTGFEVPELDGSAVDDTCRIFFVSTPDTPTTTKTTTTRTTTTKTTTTKTTTRTSPVTKQVVVTTAKKPAVQTPPFRPQPAAGPPNAAVSLLHYLLATSRGQAAGFQPIGRLPLRAYVVTSDSDESAPTWKPGSVSSEDSSDES